MANEQPKNQERKAPTPAEVHEATGKIVTVLAAFSQEEQHRIIRAAAAINGLRNTQAKR